MSEEKKIQLLIVDDNPDDRFLIEDALSKHNPKISVDTASDGLECLEKLSRGNYHLLLLDYKIPPLDGISVLNEMEKKGFQLPIIMVTGYGDENVAVEAMKRGVYDYVVKSHTYLEELPIIVSRALETNELKQEKDALERRLIQSEKMAGIGTLASGVAHEINNPLQGISIYSEMIQEADDLPTIRDFAKRIMELSDRIKGIVNGLSRFSRTVSQREVENLQLNDILDESIRLVSISPDFINMSIRKDYQAKGSFEANPVEATQIFINLINNAKDAQQGSGELAIRTWDDGKFTMAEVADSGPGIPKKMIKRIFDPFFTTKEPGQGTGLGLSITQRIIERYWGEIHLKSEPGKGAIFTVRFPINT